MRNHKRCPIVVMIACLGVTATCLGQSEPDAAELVRAVREGESWIHEVDSFYLRVESTWVRTPRGIAIEAAEIERRGAIPDPNFFPDLRPVTRETLEFAIDGEQRLRLLRDMAGVSYDIRIWDGNMAVDHSNAIYCGQEHFAIDPTPKRMFANMFYVMCWPRAQVQSCWWCPVSSEEIMERSGRPEDFVLSGRGDYHGTDCYILDWERSKVVSYRWYVGVADRRMYGYVWLMNKQPQFEHQSRDYKEVAPGCWFPMTQSYDGYDDDGEGKHYLKFRRDFKIVKVAVNEKLPDELFVVRFKPDVTVLDRRSGQTIQTMYTPELTGKPLPAWEGVDIDLTGYATEGKALLVCLFDMQQRPSRNWALQLNEEVRELDEKGVMVVGIQASRTEAEPLNEWIRENELSFPVGTVAGDERQVRFDWGAKFLPWLILTDREHVVRAEGFALSELDRRIEAMAGEESR